MKCESAIRLWQPSAYIQIMDRGGIVKEIFSYKPSNQWVLGNKWREGPGAFGDVWQEVLEKGLSFDSATENRRSRIIEK